MNIAIDCEWNGYRGELISMALVAESGEEFYEALECESPVKWVAENVIPVLGKDPVKLDKFRQKLGEYLSKYNIIHIMADWPEDIERFCNILITGPGYRIDTPPTTMQIIRIDCGSDKPHNALHDARGIMKLVKHYYSTGRAFY